MSHLMILVIPEPGQSSERVYSGEGHLEDWRDHVQKPRGYEYVLQEVRLIGNPGSPAFAACIYQVTMKRAKGYRAKQDEIRASYIHLDEGLRQILSAPIPEEGRNS